MCPVVVPAGRGAGDMEAGKAARSSSSSSASFGPQRIRHGYMKCMSLVRTQSGNRIERMYYRLGLTVGRWPLLTCVLSLLMAAVCGSGLLQWRAGMSEVDLYMPRGSVVHEAARFVETNFREDVRYESVIVEADDVLEPSVLRAIAQLEDDIKATRVNDVGWEDICIRYTSWFQEASATGLPDNLTRADVQRVVTKGLRSSQSVLTDISSILAGMKTNAKGEVVSAKAIIFNWLLKESNLTAPTWEQEFLSRVLHSNRTKPKGVNVYAVATRSYNDMLAQVMDNNMTVLFAGFSLIILYVIFMLGRCNLIQQRIYLSLLGVSIVGLTILTSYGFCFYMGFFFGPVHPILPFLLLGIGVDDMFVICDCLDHVTRQHSNLDIPERIGRAVQTAGISITVTSFTDIVAFAIGITTKMPFLQSFCMFAATGVLFLFIFEVTFFVGCLTLDEYRSAGKREGCCFIKLKEWKPNAMSQKNYVYDAFSKYIAPTLMKTPVKVLVITTTLFLVAINTWCVLQIDQKFDPTWYLDEASYPIQFYKKLNEYFPKYGKRAGVYLTNISYYDDAPKMHLLSQQLRRNQYLNQDNIKIWYDDFDKWLKIRKHEVENEDDYKGYLSEYLIFSKDGQEYLKDLKFSSFPFGEYNITTTHLPIQYVMLNTTEQQLLAMSTVFDTLNSLNLTKGQHAVAYSPDYIPWYTNKIVGEELLRNLGLSILAVAVVTLLLIQEIQITFWVIICVIFTLADLVGSMYFFGLTIEISTSIMVLLCTGLTVDYAAHIGYEFSRMPGDGNERAMGALRHMGPAVFNGGFSTFLAFVLLGFSSSYIFTTFFKLFTSVVVFGCFHGLFFLPVMLSWLGPPNYEASVHQNNVDDQAVVLKDITIPNGHCVSNVDGVEVSLVTENSKPSADHHPLPQNGGSHGGGTHGEINPESEGMLQGQKKEQGKW
ncbi:NPC intracellular cholesterol transporter 1-like isoform X2 [Thrips palmi]|uniref:NPC intracellular cholesterol transporter 1-like isoform X2 n=1 Tax=Thrips palmi TaxID=161013 RepID=A0A6P8Z062_THRPL|nr:NPC intracellular cholesterol transporter 1-like isoform X2 [Thrips palmi]